MAKVLHLHTSGRRRAGGKAGGRSSNSAAENNNNNNEGESNACIVSERATRTPHCQLIIIILKQREECTYTEMATKACGEQEFGSE